MSRTESAFNPWPYAIVGFFVFAIVAAVAWVVFCLGHGTDLVAADYYEQEIEYQAQLDRIGRGRELGERAGIVHDALASTLRIRIPREHVESGASGMIHLYRPSAAGLDRHIRLEPDGAGEQQLDVVGLAPGLWEVRVRWTVEDEDFALMEKVTIGAGRVAAVP